jgi:hypothetical protein
MGADEIVYAALNAERAQSARLRGAAYSLLAALCGVLDREPALCELATGGLACYWCSSPKGRPHDEECPVAVATRAATALFPQEAGDGR